MGGSFINTTMTASYARSFKLTDNLNFFQKLRLGVALKLNIVTFDMSTAIFGDEINPNYGFVEQSSCDRIIQGNSIIRYNPNIDMGIWYYNPFYYLGFSAKNIIQTDSLFEKFILLPREYYISSGGKINIGNDFFIHPSLNINIIQGYTGKISSFSPALMGSLKNKYFLGLSYKDLSKITIHAGAVLHNDYMLSFACGISGKNDMSGFKSPSYIGGDLKINIKK